MTQNKTKQDKPKKEAWKSCSYDGALLFLLLHKRIEGHPDDFSAAEIQHNPSYKFNKYSTQTFQRNSQTIANWVNKFEKKGTGLTDEFRDHLREVLETEVEIFNKADPDEFDETYTPSGKEEDDLTHISKAVDEISLSDNLQ